MPLTEQQIKRCLRNEYKQEMWLMSCLRTIDDCSNEVSQTRQDSTLMQHKELTCNTHTSTCAQCKKFVYSENFHRQSGELNFYLQNDIPHRDYVPHSKCQIPLQSNFTSALRTLGGERYFSMYWITLKCLQGCLMRIEASFTWRKMKLRFDKQVICI